jgi:CheY-like chemotaxis protein
MSSLCIVWILIAVTAKEVLVRVLVAEDEQVMADTIAEGLRRRAMAVDVCYDGDSAIERLSVNRYDVVILDRDLPRVHGDADPALTRSWPTRSTTRWTGSRPAMRASAGSQLTLRTSCVPRWPCSGCSPRWRWKTRTPART